MTESPEDRSRRLDADLAALTDALLAGESPQASDENGPLFAVAQQLDALIAPRTPPSAAFESRLRAEVEAAWTARPSQPGKRPLQMAVVWSLAAVAMLVVAFLLIPETAAFPVALSGAAGNSGSSWVQIPWRVALLVLGFVGLAIFWLYRLRR